MFQEAYHFIPLLPLPLDLNHHYLHLDFYSSLPIGPPVSILPLIWVYSQYNNQGDSFKTVIKLYYIFVSKPPFGTPFHTEYQLKAFLQWPARPCLILPSLPFWPNFQLLSHLILCCSHIGHLDLLQIHQAYSTLGALCLLLFSLPRMF